MNHDYNENIHDNDDRTNARNIGDDSDDKNLENNRDNDYGNKNTSIVINREEIK